VSCRSLPRIDLSAWQDSAAQGAPLQQQIGAPGATCQVAGRNIPVGASSQASPCTTCLCTATGVNMQCILNLFKISIDILLHYILI
jgi:hypothetical protein